MTLRLGGFGKECCIDMALAKRCDRCGEHYDVLNKYGQPLPTSLYTNVSLGTVDLDLCPTCFDQFLKFMGISDDDDA